MTVKIESCKSDERYECTLRYQSDLTLIEAAEILLWLDRVTDKIHDVAKEALAETGGPL